ncbi:MAG: ABC transporter permease [Planctomycetes bacterium]|nr:ABC transporter permease [Planctomycetota bacterium]
MLGVVFGVASVVAMLAVGEGASQEALEQIRKLGSNNVLISSMKPPDDQIGGTGRVRMIVYGLAYDDERRIRDTMPAVARVVPAKIVRKEGRLGERVLDLRVVGTTPEWFELVPRPVLAGRVLTGLDRERGASAAVLTEYGARRLLATANTIGQVLRLGTQYFEVVGIVQSEGGQGSSVQTPDQEVDAYIPINVARDRFGDIATKISAGSREREMVELHQLIVEAKTLADVEPLAAGLERMLERFHPKKDTRISVPLALLRQAEATKRTFNIVLGSIAGISLLVGGIGIMNIMLASVTERTREIGVRRAIGAKRRQIVAQFLIETLVLSSAGGLLGVAVGLAIPRAITYAAGMPTVVTAWSVALAFGISAGVGIVFGLYPAVRASRLDPIEALRHA